MRVATSTGWIFLIFIFGICWHIAVWLGAGQKKQKTETGCALCEARTETEDRVKHQA